MNKGDLIVHKWADFLEDFVICKITDIKHIKQYDEEWYLYSGAIFDFSQDCNLIQSEIVYSSNGKWKRGLTLYIDQVEALTLSDYFKHEPTWDDYVMFKSKYDNLYKED